MFIGIISGFCYTAKCILMFSFALYILDGSIIRCTSKKKKVKHAKLLTINQSLCSFYAAVGCRTCSNKQCKFLHILQSLLLTVSHALCAFSCTARGSQFVFPDFYHNLNSSASKFRLNVIKENVSISTASALLKELQGKKRVCYERGLLSDLWVKKNIQTSPPVPTGACTQLLEHACFRRTRSCDACQKNLTICGDAIRLARLGVASIGCGLLHSCGVLRLPIRSHILG